MRNSVVTSQGRPRVSDQLPVSSVSTRLCRLRNLLLVLAGVAMLADIPVDGHRVKLKDVPVHWGWAERRGRPRTSDTSSTD